MSDERYSGQIGGATKAMDRPMTRIEVQIETLKSLSNRIQRLTNDNIMHAHQLGFFAPNGPEKDPPTPIPVTTSLDDAIRELTMSVEKLDNSMGLFA